MQRGPKNGPLNGSLSTIGDSLPPVIFIKKVQLVLIFPEV